MRQFSFLVRRAAVRSGPVVALLALLLGLSGWFCYDSIWLYPSFIHAWAQADWLAIALKSGARGYDFFHPATFNLLTTDGVKGAGFPVPAYFAALLMGFTGRDAPGLMRGVTLAFGLGGLLALFGLVRRASGSPLKGGVVALPTGYVLTQNATYASAVVAVYPAITAALQLLATNGRLSLWRIRPGRGRSVVQPAASQRLYP